MAADPVLPQKKLHLVIQGRVQGVAFRASMRREALKLGVTGWVRNRRDGSVEAAVHGELAAVEAMVRWTQRGPELAHVAHIKIEPDDGSYIGFNVIG